MSNKKHFVQLFTFLALLSSCELLSDDEFSSPAERLEGTWTCDESSSIFKSRLDIYQVYIDKHPTDSTKIIINNFYQLGYDTDVVASVSGNSISIPGIVVDGFRISGSGSVSSNFNKIEMSYQVDDGRGEIDNATATLTKAY